MNGHGRRPTQIDSTRKIISQKRRHAEAIPNSYEKSTKGALWPFEIVRRTFVSTKRSKKSIKIDKIFWKMRQKKRSNL